jgi:hypothetical protein
MKQTDWRVHVLFAALAVGMTLVGSLIVFLVVDLIDGRTAASAMAVAMGLIFVGTFLYAYLRA